MKKFIAAMTTGVLLCSMLFFPASAVSSKAETDFDLLPEVASYTESCSECGSGTYRYSTTTVSPWLLSGYVPCLSGDMRYKDTEQYRVLNHYYLCDSCGRGFYREVEETRTLHKHSW